MIGVVVGLAAEARLARGLGGVVRIGGGDASGAGAAAAWLVSHGATALISFGLAGGLAPDLAAGALVIPEGVVEDAGRRWIANPALSAKLGPVAGWMLAAPDIIATRVAKQAAHASSGAIAADLESGAVARIATKQSLPFAVLRAVCDPAGRDLPPAALAALDAQGSIRPAALLGSLARHPGQIPALIALGREAALARRALLARVAAIGRLD